MNPRSLSRILFLLSASLSGVLSLKKSKWQRVSSLSNLSISTVLLLNKSNNGKKCIIATGAKRLWITAFLFIQREWQWICRLMFVCLRCYRRLCVCMCAYLNTSLVSHCFRLFVFTLSYIPTRLFTNRNHGNMSVLICSPDSICHHQSSTASSLHLERKRDGNQRRRTWQWGFQLKMLHQSNGASCVIKNSKATVGDGMQMICSN